MSTIARQPFAPLNQARLQRLTSQKNRQNAISITSPVKRKASAVTELDNTENVDPNLFSKRAKGIDGLFTSPDAFIKPTNFFFTKSASTNAVPISSSPKATTPRQRVMLNPTSPVAKINTSIAKAPLSAPAGRSPTRKRSGLSSRRRTAGSVTRVDPPVFGLPASSTPAPFSLDAALRGTIANYTGLHEPEMKSSWFFDIHEDTEQEEATNMLEHSACILDISSDEENESRRQREREECKENIPPPNDISQTSRHRAARSATGSDEMVYEKERSPLREMDPREYYANGCDENSVFIIASDEEEQTQVQNGFPFVAEANLPASLQAPHENLIAEPEFTEQGTSASAEELMGQTDSSAPDAAVLGPVEGTGESFEVWESSSAKDEAEVAAEY